MRKRLLALGAAAVLTLSTPVLLWAVSGRFLAVVLSLPTVLFLWLVIILRLGLWNAHGTLLDLIRGQVQPHPRNLRRDVHVQPAQTLAPYTSTVTIDLEHPVCRVCPEYLSFSLDMSQVVGGKWWNPRADRVEIGSGTVHAPQFDFNRPTLDVLTRHLAPAYLRIGGSESDKVYYDLHSDGHSPAHIPAGYESVLTRRQYDAIHEFAQRNGLQVVFTLNAGPSSRKRDGSWDDENAAQLMTYSRQQGQSVAVWELGNEVNIFWSLYGPPGQVSVDQYCCDLRKARQLVNRCSPGSRLAGQGSAFWPILGEPLSLLFGFLPAYLQQVGDVIDVVAWHYYPQQSRRGPAGSRRAHPSRLLDPRNLDEAAYWAAQMKTWRDRWAPGKALWLGETGNAQFGGEPGVSDAYIAGLWWLDQLGLLARLDHDVIVRQTLCGMNYGLLDEDSLEPRPDYWNSLLWKRLMGTQVYSVRVEGQHSGRLRVYAHATPGTDHDAVTVLAINLDHQRQAIMSFPGTEGYRCELYSVTTPDILGKTILLNGSALRLRDDSRLPDIRGCEPGRAGALALELLPLAYSFAVFHLQ